MPQSKQQETKKKQFAARKLHSRTASIGRGLNKIGRIASSDDINLANQRPMLNRSRSSEGITAGRRSRSTTKLSALQPLRHSENQIRTVVIDLPKDDSDNENDSNNNEENTHSHEDVDEIVEEVEKFSEDEEDGINSKEEPKILSYKAPPQFSHTFVPPGSSLSDKPSIPRKEESPHLDTKLESEQSDTAKLSQITEKLKLDNETPSNPPQQSVSQQQSQNGNKPDSKNDLTQYYQNMILSQSTGLVRAFADQPFQNSLLNLNRQNQANFDQLQYIHSNDRISPAGNQTFGNIKSSNNSLKQFTVNPHSLGKLGTSHESSMLSFKVEPGLAMSGMPTSKDSTNNSASGTPNNFNSFIRQGGANIETRTQQKLWLQRESSLLDLSMLNSSNPQIRREFERISREYLNARRFSNPIADSVKRTTVDNKTIRSTAGTPTSNNGVLTNNNKLIDKLKTVKSEATQNELLKLWFVNETGQSTSQNGNGVYSHHARFQQQQLQSSQGNRPLMINKSSSDYPGLSNSLRSPVAPTTRAVDRAHHSGENKRIDLSAVRLQEVEQLQKLS